jgi:adenylate kinase family enzyme
LDTSLEDSHGFSLDTHVAWQNKIRLAIYRNRLTLFLPIDDKMNRLASNSSTTVLRRALSLTQIPSCLYQRPLLYSDRVAISRLDSTQQLKSAGSVSCIEQRRPMSVSKLGTVRTFETESPSGDKKSNSKFSKPGSIAFAECETAAITDLFYQFARESDDKGEEGNYYLSLAGVRELLNSIGERPDEKTLKRLYLAADTNRDGKLSLSEFLVASDSVLGGAPARIIIVVGGPGSGKGILCQRLSEECGVVHLSSGDLLREEVKRATPLGKEVAQIMERGELVSSAVITALIRRHMRNFPGKRVMLDGFPRSIENAHDFMALMGKPELALHLHCDDTILMERIIKRGREGQESGQQRADDNFETALQRLRTFHKYHKPTMDWLREQHGMYTI